MQQSRPHPITGAPMLPLGYSHRTGRAIWPVAGGAPEPGESTGGTGTEGTPPAGTGSTPPAAPPAGEQPTLTQSQVNALLAEERRKATDKASGKYADYDDVKAKAARLDAMEAENASTLDKERAKAKAEGASEVTARANGLLIAAEVRAQAAGLRFRDPMDALAHLTTGGKLAGVKVSEDGVVDSEAVKAALTELATAKAYLIDGPPAPPPPPTPGAAGVGNGSTDKTQVAPGMDRLRNAYGKSKT